MFESIDGWLREWTAARSARGVALRWFANWGLSLAAAEYVVPEPVATAHRGPFARLVRSAVVPV